MPQLKYSTFIKTVNLTERAYAVANDMWPNIEQYIQSIGGVSAWLTKHVSHRSDAVLAKLIQDRFSSLLSQHGFLLHGFNLVLSDSVPSLGISAAYIAVKKTNNSILPLVILDIDINTSNQATILRSLFHELSHIEQKCNVLIKYTADTLSQILPVNTPVNINDLASYGETESALDISGQDELSAYANDFALKLIDIYKADLKDLPIQSRDPFIRSEILPNYASHMLPDLKEQLAKLSDSKRNYFLKQLVRQLKEFSQSLL